MVWDPDPILVQLGPIAIRYYGVIYAVALMGAFYLFRWQMLRAGHPEKEADTFLTMGVLGAIIGARLGHVFFYDAQRYLADPITILYIHKGGLASHGATIALVLVLFYYAWRFKVHFTEVFDSFSFGAAWAAILIRVGNFMNSEIVGRPTGSDWGVQFPRHDAPSLFKGDAVVNPDAYQAALANVPLRHPSQLYEVGLGILVLLALLAVDRKFGAQRPRGLLGGMFFLLYFTGRFTVEFFKDFQTLDAQQSTLTMGQYLSIPFMILGTAWIVYSLKKKHPTTIISS
ncbi:MAG: prolipoprotein diacylglyceryl transferase [Bradymonadia bacterium]